MAVLPLLLALAPVLDPSPVRKAEGPGADFRSLRRMEPVASPVVLDSASFRQGILGEWDYAYSTDGLFRRRQPTAGWFQLGARLVFERVDEEVVVKPLFYQRYYQARRGTIFEGIRYRVIDSTRPPRWWNDTCYPAGIVWSPLAEHGVSLIGWCDSDKSQEFSIRCLVGDTLVIARGGGQEIVYRRRR
jgi:hypothetical protein